jgi:transposase, IS5 family
MSEDYDKLLEIANEHRKVREFMGHIDFEDQYALQTIKDNLPLLTPEVFSDGHQPAVGCDA